MDEETVVYEAKPGRYVVQRTERGYGLWEDDVSYETLDEAKVHADGNARLFVTEYRVVDRGDSGE